MHLDEVIHLLISFLRLPLSTIRGKRESSDERGVNLRFLTLKLS